MARSSKNRLHGVGIDKEIPKGVRICQLLTSLPQIEAGTFSATNIGTVEAEFEKRKVVPRFAL
jgi:hypothetical protein